MGFSASDLTHDDFLGGRVQVYQPKVGYRAATDPVLLAAAVAAKPGQTVLELGCGVGVASLCLAARVPGLMITGVERQSDYAELARRNAGNQMNVFTADLNDLPVNLRQTSFDHVILNPPYYRAGAGNSAQDFGREQALREETPLADWLGVAARRLKPKGWLTVINLAERLPDLMQDIPHDLGSIAVLPLAARAGRPATRVLMKARKAGNAPFKLLAPMYLHEGAEHVSDGDDFTDQASAVLRSGAAISWG